MKSKHFLITIVLLFTQISFSQTVVSGKIDNYNGDANDLMVNPYFPESIGKINTEGEFKALFDEKNFKKIAKQIEDTQKNTTGHMMLATLKDFQTRYQCEDDHFSFSNADQPYLRLLDRVGFIVGNLKKNEVSGIINIVSSKEFQESQTFNPRNEPATGYMLDWYYVEKSAKVHGSCTKIMSTGNGDETYKQEVNTSLDFHQGWNLVKYEISKVYTANDGHNYSQTMSFSTLDVLPSDVKYIFTKKL